jgi:hypothetical protein
MVNQNCIDADQVVEDSVIATEFHELRPTAILVSSIRVLIQESGAPRMQKRCSVARAFNAISRPRFSITSQRCCES